VRVVVQDDVYVTLEVNGIAKAAHAYAEVLTDGDVGLGMRNSTTHFDNFFVRQYVPPSPPMPLPVGEDFEDGVAELFQVESGAWLVSAGRYSVTPVANQDGLSMLRIEQPLPASVEAGATINMNTGVSGYLSNGFVIFDYQGPADFKFAGARQGDDLWVMGHRTATSWVFDAIRSWPITAATDYRLQVVLEEGGQATLLVDGQQQLSHQFADTLTDGAIGLGSEDAVTHFDDVLVEPATMTSAAVAQAIQVPAESPGVDPSIVGWLARQYTEGREATRTAKDHTECAVDEALIHWAPLWM